MFCHLANKSAQPIFETLSTRLNRPHSLATIQADLGRALIECENWSKQMQFHGMNVGLPINEQTVKLGYGVPRKFAGSNSNESYSEDELLTLDRNFMVIGDPGSGKTTTIKRMVQLMLHSSAQTTSRLKRFPLLIVMREYPSAFSIFEMICARIGLSAHCELPKRREPAKYENKREESIHLRLGAAAIEDCVADVLNNLETTIFFDGLDEIEASQQRYAEEDISKLARSLTKSQIIATCRSGGFSRQVAGFQVTEIRPLDRTQITEIVQKWLPNPDEFFAEVSKLPSQDILDRPLLLTQMLVIFRGAGYLPSQPSAISRRLVSLLLKEWDEERRVFRRSAYANFEREQKQDFLCALAYHLTCVAKVQQFSHAQLIAAYQVIHNRFGLPLNQAADVAREIQSHTGIIFESGNDTYSFSHLTLQEYLCAEYIVREPLADLKLIYRNEYPGPLAVAVSLASNPTRWLAQLISEVSGTGLGAWATLLNRLVVERPLLERSDVLGLSVLTICHRAKTDIYDEISRFMTLPNVEDSFRDILGRYDDRHTYLTPSSIVELSRRPSTTDYAGGIRMPDTVIISRKIFDKYKN
jgi:energy-coupling factor transporter ATP-binding protein EcfA2